METALDGFAGLRGIGAAGRERRAAFVLDGLADLRRVVAAARRDGGRGGREVRLCAAAGQVGLPGGPAEDGRELVQDGFAGLFDGGVLALLEDVLCRLDGLLAGGFLREDHFLFAEGSENIIRMVVGPEGSEEEYYTEVTFDDGTTKASEVMHEWYNALVEANGIK